MSSKSLRVAVLDCHHQLAALQQVYGSYGDIHQRYVEHCFKCSTTQPMDLFVEVFKAADGKLPEHPTDYQLVVVSGSRYAVYDDTAWVQNLKQFVLEAYRQNIKLFGACFGHQIIAEALGGKAEKASNGWGLGLTDSRITQCDWMQPFKPNLSLVHIHQDQVTCLPAGAICYATSEACRFEGFVIDRQVLTNQGHPELTTDYLRDFLICRADQHYFPQSIQQQAKQSLSRQNDRDIFAKWLSHFFLDG